MANIRPLLIAELQRTLKDGGRPRLPAGGDLLWKWFLDLHQARTFHSAGPNPIAFSEIVAYAQLTGWPMRAHHIETILAMDRAYLGSVFDQAAKRGRNQPTADLDVNIFDAFFG